MMVDRRVPSAIKAAPGRLRIALACSVCGNRNYRSSKQPSETRSLSLKKFCSQCNQHTVHIEGK
jgi:large subunit ribosomal protein L33